MRSSCMALMLIFIHLCSYSQNTGNISGRVLDGSSQLPIAKASLSIKGNTIRSVSNDEGYFKINVEAGQRVVVISHIAYGQKEITVDVVAGQTTTVNTLLIPKENIGNEVVVSASQRMERIIDAPAPIVVINHKDLEQFAGSNTYETVSKVPGIEFTRSGVGGITFNARGMNSAFNNKVFFMVDNRNTMAVGSGGLPLFNNSSVVKDDIDRLEIVLGPQSALYGPNAHNAVFNIITKDPRQFQGTTVSLTAGNRSQFSGRLRHAMKINSKWAYKLTGERAAGREFEFIDSVYVGGGALGPVKAIPERNVDFDFTHLRGEAHIYFTPVAGTDIIVSGGSGNNSWVQVTTSARNQMRGVYNSFLQARIVNKNFLVNVYNSWGGVGHSYVISSYTRDYWIRTQGPLNMRMSPDSAEAFAKRYGNMFRENNQRLNADLQYKYSFSQHGVELAAGVSYQKDVPDGYGINLLDKNKRIKVTQKGAFLQLEKTLPYGLRIIGAGRFDNHSNFGDFFSPRFALLKAVGNGNIRLTWGRAYAMPSILNQYANINGTLYGNGAGIYYIPNNTKFSDPNSVKMTTPLKPEQVRTWELGYRGFVLPGLFADVNSYYGTSKNFISQTQTVEGRALSAYAVELTPLRPGIVENDTLKNAQFSTFFNYGEVKSWGIDAGITYHFNKKINAGIRYSWFNSDITKYNPQNDANNDGYVSEEERSLNAPTHRGVIMLNTQDVFKKGVFTNIVVRLVEQYDFYSAIQIGTAAGKGKRGFIERPGKPKLDKNFNHGPLGGFVSVDLAAGYAWNENVSLNVGVTNLFDTEQVEFVASPSIGRLISVEIKVHMPRK